MKSISFFLGFLFCAQFTFGQKEQSCDTAQYLLANYQFKQASIAFEGCYQNDTTQFEFLELIAYCESKLGNSKKAKAYYHRFLRLDSTNIQAQNNLAKLYKQDEDLKSAKRIYSSLALQDSLNPYYQKELGNIALQNGEILTALKYYGKAFNLNPKDLESLAALVKINLGLKLYPEADSLITVGLALDSLNKKLLFHRAVSAYKQQNYLATEKASTLLLHHFKDSTSYLLKLNAISNHHLKKYHQSINLLELLISNGQESEVVYYYLGLSYRELKQMDKAAVAFEKAIEHSVSKNLNTYYTNLAVTYEEKGNYEASIKAYQVAYKTSNDKTLLYHLARNYDMYYKDKKTALKYYEMYLSANDTHNLGYMDYSEHRINELKASAHFDISEN